MVGHAAGGVIGLALALRRPERVSRSLVVDQRLRRTRSAFRPRRMETRLASAPSAAACVAFVRAQPLFLYPARWISKAYARLAGRGGRAMSPISRARRMSRRGSRARRLRHRRPARRRSRRLTLLIAAEDDMLVPTSAPSSSQQGLPHARWHGCAAATLCNRHQRPNDLQPPRCSWISAGS